MSSIKPLFTAKAHSTGGRNGKSEADDGTVSVTLSVPKEMGGPGKPGTTTPEHLFATGYAGRNEEEYFAMAVEHLVARADGADASVVGAAWYEAHDPDVRSFVQSIGASKGDLTKVRCPR